MPTTSRLLPLATGLLLVVPAAAVAESPRVEWSGDIAASFRGAAETLRPVLVHVTANPCGPKAPIGNPGDVHETDCELLESRTLATSVFAQAAERFVPVLVYQASGDANPSAVEFIRRHRIGTVPTLLISDPWGNEVIRMIGATPLDKAVRVLRAVPGDFRPLRAAGEALRNDPAQLEPLLSAAAFYEQAGVGPFAERYYERAAQSPAAKSDAGQRRRVVIARGLNLLQMNQPKDAAKLFSGEADAGLGLPQSEVIVFGWAMASLAGGDRGKAQSLAKELATRFPDSPYTKRLQENLSR